MRGGTALTIAALLALASTVEAQERYQVSVNIGLQATSTQVTEEQTFDQYFERGSFTLDRTVPRTLVVDAGLTVRLWRDLHAGMTVSMFEDTGPGDVTARVPHPFFFNQPRTSTAEIAGVTRREVGQHVTVGWALPTMRGLDVLVFGGPSVFTTEQGFVTTLMLSLDKEVYPYDALAFPGAVTETQRANVLGYNAGVDITWRFARRVGAGLLIRYAHGRKDFEPSGGTPVEIEVGGLAAGGGLRLAF